MEEVRSASNRMSTLNLSRSLSSVQCKNCDASVKYLPFNCVCVLLASVCINRSIHWMFVYTIYVAVAVVACVCVCCFFRWWCFGFCWNLASKTHWLRHTHTDTDIVNEFVHIRFRLQLCCCCFFPLSAISCNLLNQTPHREWDTNRTNGIKFTTGNEKKNTQSAHTHNKPFLRNLKQSIKFIECAFKAFGCVFLFLVYFIVAKLPASLLRFQLHILWAYKIYNNVQQLKACLNLYTHFQSGKNGDTWW